VVQSDPSYLRRILQNLIGNAIRYTGSGRVLVGARLRGGMLRVEVWDTGPGIPEAEQGNIFKEFHRLNAPASASEGMGLGLAIVERACALLGHPLGLSSRMGRGTCFVIQVPLADSIADSPAQTPVPDMSAGQDKIAFLVENDDALRRAMGLLLEKWGLSVLEAATAEEALALIAELGILPDFLLVDYQLGAGMDGLGFLDALFGLHGPIPARMVTANRSLALQQACTARGIEILVKPIDARALQTVVASLTTKAP
jgi:CheY-like chemotaxis protein